ncbi:hypothetical protein HDE_02030 [Halotydeus destructor]|nr:hypothetical protein HDE_02030 [Halotydeus destructor]
METIPANILLLDAVGFYGYDEDTKQLSGIAALFYDGILIKKRINATYQMVNAGNFIGTCDQYKRCTGNLGLVNIIDWDYMLPPIATTGLDYVEYLPLKLDIEAFAAHYELMSSFDLKDNENVEVVSSFKNISLNVVFLYIMWCVIAYMISLAIRKFLIEVVTYKTMYKQSYLWHMMRIVCGQYYPMYEKFSLRTLETVLVISIFYLVQYYYGNYGTELTVRSEADVIDTFEQLQASDKIPAFLEIDPIMSFLNLSDNEAHRSALGKLRFDSNGKADSIIETNGGKGLPPAVAANWIRNKNGAPVMMSYMLESIKYFYCQQSVEDQNGRKIEPTLHVSNEQFFPTLFMQVSSLNISAKLGQRLHDSFRRVFETRLYTALVADKFLAIFLDLLNDAPTREVNECLQHTFDSSNDVKVLTSFHFRTVFYLTMSAILIAVIVLIGEHAFTCRRKSKRHGLRHRKKNVGCR